MKQKTARRILSRGAKRIAKINAGIEKPDKEFIKEFRRAQSVLLGK